MKVQKKPIVQTRELYKIIYALMIMSKIVMYCPWIFNKTTGDITVGKYRTWVIPFIFLSRFFGFVFFRFSFLPGITQNPFLALSLCRGIAFSLHQFYYTVEVFIKSKRVAALIKEIEDLFMLLNPKEKILKRIYWETIFSFSTYMVVLIIASTIANNVVSKSFTGFIIVMFYYQYLGCTYVFDCHVIVFLRLIALAMNTLSKNLERVSYKKETTLLTSSMIHQLDMHYLRNVGELRIICRRLFDLKDSLAECFRGRLVSSSLMIFIDLAFFTYATYTFFTIESNADYLLIIGGNCWVILNFIKLFYITNSGQTVEKAAANLSANLMKLVTVNTPKTVSMELLAISQELMHRTPSVNIGGIFKLNDGLAVSIISTSFTYIIILLQFNLKITTTLATTSAVESLLTFF